MEIKIQKAERKRARMRIEIASMSGSGKTYSSLLLAKGLAGGDLSKVCMIDTENGSGHLYSHLGDYSVVELQPEECTTDNILQVFKAIEDNGFEVIIRDSSSARWDRILKKNDEVAKQLSGNSFRAWGRVTPLYDKVIQHLLASPCHIIVTARKKQDWAIETNDQGKTVIKKVGMKDIQRDSLEYEMGIVFNLDQLHYATVSKDRTELFDGQDAFVITEDTGKQIKEWCESGVEVKVESKPKVKKEEPKVKTPASDLPEISDERFAKACEVIKDGKATVESLTQHFKLSENQTNIVNELFMKKA